MPFHIGQTVVCVTPSSLLVAGQQYRIANVYQQNGERFVRVEETRMVPFYEWRFRALMPDEVDTLNVIVEGTVVEVIDAPVPRNGGYWVGCYTTPTVNRGDRVQVEAVRTHPKYGLQYRILGRWMAARRFRRATVQTVSKVQTKPKAQPYAVQGFYGCCGAGIIYCETHTSPDIDRIKAAEERARVTNGFGTVLIILNKGQNKNAEKKLLEAGWSLVGQSLNRPGSSTLYTWFKAIKPVKTVEEQARRFG